MEKNKANASHSTALCIGLNSVDPGHYQGWSGELEACEADARDMATLARAAGVKDVTTLLTAQAGRRPVLNAIQAAADRLTAGDFFLLTYSGHGGQLPDRNNDEPDGQDETWCLFDGELVDDELFMALSQFTDGVRIVVLSDSCHSGTVIKATLVSRMADVRYRAMPRDVARRTYEANRPMYDPILREMRLAKAQDTVKTACLLISGCQDNQLSADGTFNGLFTGTLLSVWKSGLFKGSYMDLHKAIVKRMPADQTPNLFGLGKNFLKLAQAPAFQI